MLSVPNIAMLFVDTITITIAICQVQSCWGHVDTCCIMRLLLILVTLGTSHATKAETDSRCRCQECLTALTYDMAVDNLTTELVQHENNLRLDAILMSKATCSACMQLCLILHFTP